MIRSEMSEASPEPVYYKRSRFSSKLPSDRLYTPSHYWIREVASGLWQVGLTKFATRMLGDFVEINFGAAEGEAVTLGQAIGTVEGFKALTDIYCVLDGAFAGGNAALRQDITLADSQPYGDGWLYQVKGTPDPAATDVHGYVAMLDLTIEKMLSKGQVPAGDDAPDACD